MTKRSEFDFNLFRAMEVFAAVVETRQVTRVAGLLGMTQSAASQQLHSLEEALGSKLLDRRSRPIELTRAGISLHRRALRILAEIDDLKVDMRRLESAPMPVLRVGLLASIATTLTSKVVALARERFEVPEVAVYAGLASDHQNLLRNRRADMVVTSDALYDVDGLERHPVLRESFLLVLPPAFEGPLDDLAALSRILPFVRFTAEAPVGRLTDQHLRRVRLELPRTIEADRSSMVVAAVEAGQGFAMLTPTLLLDGLAEGMRVRISPLPIPGFQRTITLVARTGELGSLPRLFAAELAETLSLAIARRLPQLPETTVAFPE